MNEPQRLAYVTQTTLSIDDTRGVIDALKQRFPSIRGPDLDGICYATQNRQHAVRRLAERVDVLLVVGARNSSNSNRLREMGEHAGVASHLVQDASDLEPSWFRPGLRVGVTAGASTPEVLVGEVIQRLRSFGASRVSVEAEPERTTFRLPAALLKRMRHA